MNPVRRLARCLQAGGPVPDDEWGVLSATAERFQLGPALWVALASSRADAAPTRDEVLLHRAFVINTSRIADLLAQCDVVLDALGAARIPAVPLKGADALRNGRYPTPGARTMTDIDILVPAGQADAAEAVLDRVGYVIQPAPASPHQRPPRALPCRPGSIELHTDLLVPRWAAALDPAAVLARATDGHLDRTDAATHLIAHAQLQDEAYLLGQVPLRALHETALIIDGDEVVDWPRVMEAFDRVGKGRAVLTHLALVTSLFAVDPPMSVARGVRTRATLAIAAAADEHRALVTAQIRHLPRSLAAERMAVLYPGTGLHRSRLAHLSNGLRRRWGKLAG